MTPIKASVSGWTAFDNVSCEIWERGIKYHEAQVAPGVKEVAVNIDAVGLAEVP